MTGLGQKKFIKRYSPFWKETKLSRLESLYDRGFIQRIDYQSALLLSGELVEEAGLLFAYLFSASRQGHLCVRVFPNLFPKLDQLWVNEAQTLDKEEAEELSAFILEAFQKMPKAFFEKHSQIVLEDSLLYLQKNWLYEREVWDSFKKWEVSKPSLSIKEISFNSALFPEQKEAIRTSLNHCVSFITGGPGVGKTYTASHLIHTFLKSFPKARVALVAPTGKAVANLQSHFLKFIESQGENPLVDIFTLHKLFSQKIYSFLPYDLILVDESSMIDLGFMRKLLKWIKPHSRLIFLGDPNQLPPIESGFIFYDLIQESQHKSHLAHCIRVERKDLIEAAEAVNRGDENVFLNFIQSKGILFPLEGIKKADFYEHLISLFPKIDPKLSPIELLQAYQTFKVLSPIRKGSFGVDALNDELKEIFSFQNMQPILITANDYRLELFNGDIGILVDQDHALFFSRRAEESYYEAEDQVRRIPQALLPPFEYAYAVSVHKSQGSEYDRAAIILPPASEVFGREMLYTAMTRAKKHFDIFGDLPTLKRILKSSAIRYSGLQARRDTT